MSLSGSAEHWYAPHSYSPLSINQPLIMPHPSALAHEHHTVEEIDDREPIDAILWIHVSLGLPANLDTADSDDR